jgi:hypothetical protein
MLCGHASLTRLPTHCWRGPQQVACVNISCYCCKQSSSRFPPTPPAAHAPHMVHAPLIAPGPRGIITLRLFSAKELVVKGVRKEDEEASGIQRKDPGRLRMIRVAAAVARPTLSADRRAYSRACPRESARRRLQRRLPSYAGGAWKLLRHAAATGCGDTGCRALRAGGLERDLLQSVAVTCPGAACGERAERAPGQGHATGPAYAWGEVLGIGVLMGGRVEVKRVPSASVGVAGEGVTLAGGKRGTRPGPPMQCGEELPSMARSGIRKAQGPTAKAQLRAASDGAGTCAGEVYTGSAFFCEARRAECAIRRGSRPRLGPRGDVPSSSDRHMGWTGTGPGVYAVAWQSRRCREAGHGPCRAGCWQRGLQQCGLRGAAEGVARGSLRAHKRTGSALCPSLHRREGVRGKEPRSAMAASMGGSPAHTGTKPLQKARGCSQAGGGCMHAPPPASGGGSLDPSAGCCRVCAAARHGP